MKALSLPGGSGHLVDFFSLLGSSVEREGKSLICLYALLITHGWLCSNPQRVEGKAPVRTSLSDGSSELPYLNTLEGGRAGGRRERESERGDHRPL